MTNISKLRTIFRTMLLTGATLLIAGPAFADTIGLNLANPNQTATAGSTVSFTGTVLLSGGTSPVYLDDAYTVTAPANLNDDGFFFGVSLAPFAPGSSLTGLLFTVSLPANLAAGNYGGTFTIFEDSNPAVTTTSNYQVTILGSASPVPEPSTWALLATGLTLGLGAFTLNGKFHRQAFPTA